MEIWIRPSGPVAPSSQRGGSESSRDSEQDGELVSLSASEVRTSVSSGSFVFVLLFSVAVVLVYSVLSTAGSSGFISAYNEKQEVQLCLSKFISSVYFISSFNDVPLTLSTFFPSQ